MATYWSDMCNSPTCVYRLYACDGTLLYVGMSRNLLGRFSKHARREWWGEVDHHTEEWFPDRTQALAAERSAIHHEGPLYNLTRPRMECC